MAKNEINVCCPCLLLMRCGDAELSPIVVGNELLPKHQHLGCRVLIAEREMMTNRMATSICISNCGWEKCEHYRASLYNPHLDK